MARHGIDMQGTIAGTRRIVRSAATGPGTIITALTERFSPRQVMIPPAPSAAAFHRARARL